MVVLSSFPPPEEGVIHKQEATQAHIQGQGFIGNGTLYIAESRVSWRSATGQGFSLEYKAISLHAVSRDLSAFPHQCLYLMLDTDLQPDTGNQDSSGDSGSESGGLTEVRFVPDNKDALDSMFSAMSSCQALHPDEDDSISEEELGFGEGNGDYYNTEEGAEFLSRDGQETLQRLEHVFNDGSGDTRDIQPQAGGLQDDREDEADMEMDAQEDQFQDADMDR